VLSPEEVEKGRPFALFYPKFHCELNFIEMFWLLPPRIAWDYAWSPRIRLDLVNKPVFQHESSDHGGLPNRVAYRTEEFTTW
jgi:hypothetical protein